MQIATAPGTWGIEPPAPQPHYPRWEIVLDEISAAGFDGSELGPLGYLPEKSAALTQALGGRGLEMPAGFVMDDLSDAESAERIRAIAARTCSVLAGVGAGVLVLIDGLSPRRSATAGRTDDAERLGPEAWGNLISTSRAVCEIAAEQGMVVAFHPHAGTGVEFEDEIARLMDDLDAPNAGLCLDCGHAAFSGVDALGLVDAYRDRLHHVHLKDVDEAALIDVRERRLTFEEAVARGVFTPLGGGSVQLDRLAARLRDRAYSGWATFEQDRVLDTIGDALPEAGASLEHARAVGF